MQFHVGRLIDHVHLRVAHVPASKRFYKAVLTALGLPEALIEGRDSFRADELYVNKADGPVSRVHLAFRRTVASRWMPSIAPLSPRGDVTGAPGQRDYHPGYYCAFVLDPDGNNIEAVFHGALTRSAPSVILTPTGS